MHARGGFAPAQFCPKGPKHRQISRSGNPPLCLDILITTRRKCRNVAQDETWCIETRPPRPLTGRLTVRRENAAERTITSSRVTEPPLMFGNIERSSPSPSPMRSCAAASRVCNVWLCFSSPKKKMTGDGERFLSDGRCVSPFAQCAKPRLWGRLFVGCWTGLHLHLYGQLNYWRLVKVENPEGSETEA